MDIEGVTPLEHAKSLLGEFYRNYVIIVQEDDEPTNYDVTYSDPFAAKGLLELANKYQTTFLEGGTDTEMNWIWEETDDEEDEMD